MGSCSGAGRYFIIVSTRGASLRLSTFFESFSYLSSFPDGIFMLLLKLLKAVKG
jgi:hypothetical protein